MSIFLNFNDQEIQLCKVIDKNADLTVGNSDLHKQLQEYKQVNLY